MVKSIESEKPATFTIRGKKIFGTGEAEPLVFERIGTTGSFYVARPRACRESARAEEAAAKMVKQMATANESKHGTRVLLGSVNIGGDVRFSVESWRALEQLQKRLGDRILNLLEGRKLKEGRGLITPEDVSECTAEAMKEIIEILATRHGS